MSSTTVELVRDAARDPFEIPDGSIPVGTARIADDPHTLLVHFPRGWQRESFGYYLAGEEFVVLAGALSLSDDVHGAGSWVHVPPRSLRAGTRTPEGALALAWFDGPPTWVRDDAGSSGPATHVDLGRAARSNAATPYGPGRTLRRGRTFWVTQLAAGPDDRVRQVLVPGDNGRPPVLHTLAPGDPLPDVSGPCMVRTSEER